MGVGVRSVGLSVRVSVDADVDMCRSLGMISPAAAPEFVSTSSVYRTAKVEGLPEM